MAGKDSVKQVQNDEQNTPTDARTRDNVTGKLKAPDTAAKPSESAQKVSQDLRSKFGNPVRVDLPDVFVFEGARMGPGPVEVDPAEGYDPKNPDAETEGQRKLRFMGKAVDTHVKHTQDRMKAFRQEGIRKPAPAPIHEILDDSEAEDITPPKRDRNEEE